MVPPEEWEKLTTKYKNGVTSNALLNKIGRLGATEEIILGTSDIPASMAMKLTQPLAKQRRNLTKRLKTGAIGTSPSYNVSQDEPEAMVDSPAEALIKRAMKAVKESPSRTPAPVIRRTIKRKQPTAGSSKKKKVIKKASQPTTPSLPAQWYDSDDTDTLLGSYAPPKGKKGKKPVKKKSDPLYHSPTPAKRGPIEYGSSSDDEFLSFPPGWEQF